MVFWHLSHKSLQYHQFVKKLKELRVFNIESRPFHGGVDQQILGRIQIVTGVNIGDGNAHLLLFPHSTANPFRTIFSNPYILHLVRKHSIILFCDLPPTKNICKEHQDPNYTVIEHYRHTDQN